MNEPTPGSNLIKVTKLGGEMSTLKAEIKGQMEVQSINIQHMKESSDKIEKSVDRLTEHCTKLFETQDEQGQDLVKLGAKQEGHEEVCKERDKAIHIQIQTGFNSLKTEKATEKENAKESKSDKKWRIATFLTAAGLIVAILVAMFN